MATRSWILLCKKKNKDVCFSYKPNILCSGNLSTFSSSHLLGSCNGEGKGQNPNNIIDHRSLAVACDVMRLVTGVWSILFRRSVNCWAVWRKKVWVEWRGFIYKGREEEIENVLVYTWIIFFFFGLSERINDSQLWE